MVMIDEEDEGVYDESPDNSQLLELLPNGCQSSLAHGENKQIAGSSDHESRSRFMAPGITAGRCGSGVASKGTMSFARTSFLVFSIAVCVTYAVSVLWLVPCQLSPCQLSSAEGNPLPSNWLRQYPFIRITANLQTVVVESGQGTAIILAYKTVSDHNKRAIHQSKPATPLLCGVMALREEDGKELWKQPFYTEIIDVACNSIDVNSDGFLDCLITGTAGLVAAMSASTGQIFWYLHNHDDHSVSFLALSSAQPLHNTDLDGDSVQDLVVIALFNHGMHNSSINVAHSDSPLLDHQRNFSRSQLPHVLFVSGSSGQTIGHSLPLPFICDRVVKFRQNDTIILPNPVLLRTDNGSLALLLSSNTEDGSHEFSSKMGGAKIYMMLIDDMYEAAISNCSNESTESGGITDGVFRQSFHVDEIYSVDNNIKSMYPVMQADCKANGVLIYANDGKMIMLNGCNGLKPSWNFSRRGHIFSKPVFGLYDNDELFDVFVTAKPTDCFEDNCKLQAIICDGIDGHVLSEIVTPCNVFIPVIANGHSFLFTSPALQKTKGATVNQTASITTSKIISNGQTLEYVTMPAFKTQNVSGLEASDRMQPLLNVLQFDHMEYGSGNFSSASKVITTCRSDPEEFYAKVFQSGDHRQLLISVHNMETSSQVSRVDISTLFP